MSCGPLPSPVTVTGITDRPPGLTSHSGTVSITIPFADNDPCFEINKVEILRRSRIDDFGTVGGVSFANNTPCSSPGSGDGVVTIVGADTILTNYTFTGTTVNIPWSAQSDTNCGPPTGLVNAAFRVTFQLKPTTTEGPTPPPTTSPPTTTTIGPCCFPNPTAPLILQPILPNFTTKQGENLTINKTSPLEMNFLNETIGLDEPQTTTTQPLITTTTKKPTFVIGYGCEEYCKKLGF